MNKKGDIERKAEAAMNSLDGIHPASPGPFFFTRVMARVNRAEKNPWEQAGAFIARPVVAIAVVMLVILMNAGAVLQEKESSPSIAEQTEQSNFDELDLTANTYYDYEIKEP
jgi:hypothetical protein